ncbi:molybdopterin-dependent oxidoreductase [Roseomonas mucosa]|nr:molybdopterin-dependent oxidoreductase [Roseomonas mucosa]
MTRSPQPAADPAHQADKGDNSIPARPAPAKIDGSAQSREARQRLNSNRGRAAHDAPVVGPTMTRYDGREKVLGTARYADDVPLANAVYAYAVVSPVARGRIRAVNTRAADEVGGVLRVYTHAAMAGRLKPARFVGQGGQATSDLAVMCGPEIVHAGQIIGLVVAESFEAAREAAHLIRYDIDEQPWAATFDDPGLRVRPVADLDPNWLDPAVGDAHAVFASAPLSVEAAYSTPPQHHNPIELFSTSCWWEHDRLIVHEPSAGVAILQIGLATQLGIAPEKIDVVSPYVGGSFGAKVNMTPRTALAAIAARDLGRPVRLVLTRTQGFTQSTHRGETRHIVRLACDRSGKMLAYGHEASEVSSRTDAYTVKGTTVSVHMYGWAHAETKVFVAEADRSTPGFMRAPAEVPYMFALECAVDELAEKAGTDPVEFRKINDAQTTAYQNKSYTSKSLNECLNAGAEAFDWAKRDRRLGSMFKGEWQVGYGVAAACYPTAFSVTAVRVRVTADGLVDQHLFPLCCA